MRNAALVLGIIGGVWGMLVGFFSFAWTDLLASNQALAEWFGPVDNPALIRAASLGAPLLAIAGGAMARSQNIAAGVMLLASAAGMHLAFGFGAFTMFPIAMCALGGLLALGARKPDPH